MINNLADKLKIKYTKASISTVNSATLKDCDTGPIQTIVSYVNTLPVPIVVVDRSGFRHTVPNIYSNYDSFFTVYIQIKIRHDSINEVKRLLSFISTDNNQELKIIKEIFLDQKDQRSYLGFTAHLSYKISLNELKESDGSIYIKNKDIVISTKNINDAPAHPYAEDTISNDFFMGINNDEQELGSPTVKIEIIDNNMQIGDRFVMILGTVRKITPKTDIKRESGVYVSTLEPNVINDLGYSITYARYDLVDMEKELFIFKTKDLAISAGDIAGVRKEELIRMEHSNILLKQDIANNKQKYDAEVSRLQAEKTIDTLNYEKEILELKRQKDRLEHQQEIDKAERKEYYDKIAQERKDHYDHTSSRRKDSSDLMKFLPAAIMAMGAVYMAFTKIVPAK